MVAPFKKSLFAVFFTKQIWKFEESPDTLRIAWQCFLEFQYIRFLKCMKVFNVTGNKVVHVLGLQPMKKHVSGF